MEIKSKIINTEAAKKILKSEEYKEYETFKKEMT